MQEGYQRPAPRTAIPVGGDAVLAPLKLGELWAVPIMLRLVLVENLRRLCSHMLVTRDCRDRANRILTTPTCLNKGMMSPSDLVIIDRGAFNPTVTLATGTVTVRSLRSDEPDRKSVV